MNDEGVYRTAPATPGLLTTSGSAGPKLMHKKNRIHETKNFSTDADIRTDTIWERLRDLSQKRKNNIDAYGRHQLS